MTFYCSRLIQPAIMTMKKCQGVTFIPEGYRGQRALVGQQPRGRGGAQTSFFRQV